MENENRLENIKELLSAMKEFDTLESFLEHVSSNIDRSKWDGEKVNMMTMHAARGLSLTQFLQLGGGSISSSKIYKEKGQSGLEEEKASLCWNCRAKELTFPFQ